MKCYLENIFHKNKKIYIISFLIAGIISFLNIGTNSKKDILMLFIATILFVNIIYLLSENNNKSIYLFLICLPIFVTGRKFMLIDFFVFKISFESIYITLLFIINFKNIILTLKYKVRTVLDKRAFNFYILVCVFIIFVYNSNTYSVIFWKSMSDTYLGIIIPIMFMITILSTIQKKDVKKIIYCTIISINLSCLYGIVQILKDGINVHAIIKNRALLTFGYHNVNIFAGILVTILPLLLEYILYKEKSKNEKIFLYLSLLVETVALIITFTRGAWITAIIGVFLLLLSKKYRKIIIPIFLLGIIFIKPIMSFIISRGKAAESLLRNESAVARIQSIYTDIGIMKKYIFGVGMSNFAHYYKEFAGRGYLMMPENLRWSIRAAHYMLEHAHNLILQIGVEFGMVSLIAFLLMIINRIKIAFEDYTKNRGLIVSLISFFIISTLTGFEFNHKGVITGSIIIFLIMGLIEINNSKETIKDI